MGQNEQGLVCTQRDSGQLGKLIVWHGLLYFYFAFSNLEKKGAKKLEIRAKMGLVRGIEPGARNQRPHQCGPGGLPAKPT